MRYLCCVTVYGFWLGSASLDAITEQIPNALMRNLAEAQSYNNINDFKYLPSSFARTTCAHDARSKPDYKRMGKSWKAVYE